MMLALGVHGLLLLALLQLLPERTVLATAQPESEKVYLTVPRQESLGKPKRAATQSGAKSNKVTPKPAPQPVITEQPVPQVPAVVTMEVTEPAAPQPTDTPIQAPGTAGVAGNGSSDSNAGNGGQGLFADCANEPERPLVAQLFHIPVGTRVLPDFEQLTAVKTICMEQLNITSRKFSGGFPGLENLFEWFGLNIRFTVNVPEDAVWKFELAADDGAQLWIDGEQVINHDGIHSATRKSASMYLSAGAHDFNVRYFQGPRYDMGLVLRWKKDTFLSFFSYIPREFLTRPRKAQGF